MDGVENPVQNVTFPSNGATAYGYLAFPESGSGPGLVVIRARLARRPDRGRVRRHAAVPPVPGGPRLLQPENLIGTYDAEQATPAWTRTLGFLRSNLT